MLISSYANRSAFRVQNPASALHFEGKNKKNKKAPKQAPQPPQASQIRTAPAADELVKSAEKSDTKPQEQSDTPTVQAPASSLTEHDKQPPAESRISSEQALEPSNEPEKSIASLPESENPKVKNEPKRIDEDKPDWEEISESEDEEAAVAIERPETGDYLKWRDEREKAELLAIGKRFAVPGRVLNGMENQAKSWSRSLADKSKNIATGATNMVCDKAVSTLKASAKAIENWQHSGKP